MLTGVGLTVRPRGTGFVARQSPEPGEPIDPGCLEPARTAANRFGCRTPGAAMTLDALVAAARTLAPDARQPC